MKFVSNNTQGKRHKVGRRANRLGDHSFEGNYYVRRKYLATDRLKPNFIPGLCPYMFLYVWLDFKFGDGREVPNLGWLRNPLFPFICLDFHLFRVGLLGTHPELLVEKFER